MRTYRVLHTANKAEYLVTRPADAPVELPDPQQGDLFTVANGYDLVQRS